MLYVFIFLLNNLNVNIYYMRNKIKYTDYLKLYILIFIIIEFIFRLNLKKESNAKITNNKNFLFHLNIYWKKFQSSAKELRNNW